MSTVGFPFGRAIAAQALSAIIIVMTPTFVSAKTEITADNGIEWQRDKYKVIANGNALLVHDGVEIASDHIELSYAETVDGIEARTIISNSQVRLTKDGYEINGSSADVDVSLNRIIVKGAPATLSTAKGNLSGSVIVYDGTAGEIKASSPARAETEAAIVTSRSIEVYVVDETISRYVSRGDCEVVYNGRRATADEVVYDVSEGLLTMTGNVTIMEDTGEVGGEQFVYDVKRRVGRIVGKSRIQIQ